MLVFEGNKWGLRLTQVSWPESPEILRKQSRACPIIRVMYADESIVAAIADLRIYSKELHTTIIPLDQPQEELLRRMDAKSCRYELRKSEKLGYHYSANQGTEEAFDLFQSFFSSNGYRGPLTRKEWNDYLRIADIHTIRHGTALIAAHVVVRDAPHRVRLLLSATADRNSGELRNVIGPLNRRLHWCEMLFYKDQGYPEYDFGGVLIDPQDPGYSIAQFKNSFGGMPKKEYSLVIIHNPLLRMVARFFVFLRSRSPTLLKLLKF